MARGEYNNTMDVYDPHGIWNNPNPSKVVSNIPCRLVPQLLIQQPVIWAYRITAWVTFDGVVLASVPGDFSFEEGTITLLYGSCLYFAIPSGGPINYVGIDTYIVTSHNQPQYRRVILTTYPLPY